MPKKEIIYQGLDQLQVEFNDTTINSPDYLRIISFPNECTAGKNLLKFKGNSNTISEDVPILIEILDYNRNPIYYEISLDTESESQSAIVSIFINEDTSPGDGLITICTAINGSNVINFKWNRVISIDPSKRSSSDILFDKLPSSVIVPSTGSYTNYGYPGGSKVQTITTTNLSYQNINNISLLVTSSLSNIGFDNTSLSAKVYIPYTSLSSIVPVTTNTINSSLVYTGSISGYSGSGVAYIEPIISFPVEENNSIYLLRTGNILSSSIEYEQSASLSNITTENSFNQVTVYFSNLDTKVGEISKIKSYYRSTGVGEYILSNETDISILSTEFGFNLSAVTCSFMLPTVHRNDRLDFKFEFINPVGVASKQSIDALDYLFLGGNTYIGGDDNMLTGSLFVSGHTGTGVHISGKNSAALIRSIGYTGFYNAINNGGAGFAIYSGSVQPLLNSSESYSGVGLELVSNSASYFKYTTSGGGNIDIRADSFFIGNSNTFISSSNNNLEIKNKDGNLTKFHLHPNGEVTASAFIAFTGSSDTSKYLMMDTKVGLIDGKNIGRLIYYQPAVHTIPYLRTGGTPIQSPIPNQLNSIDVTAAFTSSLTWVPLVVTQSFIGLPFENALTVFGNVGLEKMTTNSTTAGWHKDDARAVIIMKLSLSSIVTSSYATFGEYDTQVAISTGSIVFGTSTSLGILSSSYTMDSTTTTGSLYTQSPFKAVMQIPSNISDTMCLINLDYAMVRLNSLSGVTLDVEFRSKIANINIISGRTLFSSNISGHNNIASYYDSITYPSIE